MPHGQSERPELASPEGEAAAPNSRHGRDRTARSKAGCIEGAAITFGGLRRIAETTVTATEPS